jgi:hypothetical protein
VEKFTTTDKRTDISHGPVKDRGCTDSVCILLYAANWVVFLFVILYGVESGSPEKLFLARDYSGAYCGLEKNYDGGPNFKDFTKSSYTMNVSKAVDIPGKQLMCSTFAMNFLVGPSSPLSTRQKDAYLCDCCLSPCTKCDGSLEVGNDVTSASELYNVGNKMADLVSTDLSNAANIFSPGGFNGDAFYNMWNQAYAYFNKVCLPTCDTDYITTNSSTAPRIYTYAPSPDDPLSPIWAALQSSSAPAAINVLINTSFSFKALPISECPYDPVLCVPFPGVVFKELTLGQCEFEVASDVVNAVGSSVASSWETIGGDQFADGAGETVGKWWGDFENSIGAFVLTCVCSFVIGLIFLVVLRFSIGFCVWFAVFFVLCLFALGGGMAFVRSAQCKEAKFFDTGQQMAGAVAVTAQTAVVNAGDVTTNEAMSGDGADYRGIQYRTKSLYTCKHWDQTTLYLPADYPDSGLTENYCRNPYNASSARIDGGGTIYGAATIWCYTTSVDKKWEECTPVGQIMPACEHGYAIPGETARKAMEIFAYVLWSLGGLWLLIVLCYVKKINEAIAVNQVAALFVQDNVLCMLVPLVQVIISIVWCVLWGLSVSFLVSQVPDGYVPNDWYASEPEAAEQCFGRGLFDIELMRVEGFTYKEYDCPTVDGVVSCWRCGPPRYVLDLRGWYSLFHFLWTNAFFVAMGQLILAGAVSEWFFTPKAEKGRKSFIKQGLWNALRYHSGSAAFGSLIIAIVQTIKYILMYAERQARGQNNRVAALILKCMICCIWCLEKCLKYINKQAYIQVALMGTNFCTSCINTFKLFFRNMARFGILAVLGAVIHNIGYFFIMACTTILGYFILRGLNPEQSHVLTLVFIVLVSGLVGKLYMNVFGMAVDTSLQCLIAAEEMGITESAVPAPLAGHFKKLIKDGQ